MERGKNMPNLLKRRGKGEKANYNYGSLTLLKLENVATTGTVAVVSI